MITILDAMLMFFEQDGWPVQYTQNDHMLTVTFQGENGQWQCFAQAREEVSQFAFYSICPASAPQNKRAVIAEFLTRANYGLLLGNFEMDYDDGVIRYKTSIDVEDYELHPVLVKNLVYGNIAIMDQYLPGIMQVIYSHTAPADAINEIESKGWLAGGSLTMGDR